MSSMSIGQLARMVGIGVETVRYYQRRGLLRDPRPSKMPGAGIRHYDETDVQTLKFIAAGKNAGFTLAEIARLKELDALDDRSEARRLAQERIAALDADIARLQHARDHLSRLAHECGAGAGGLCPIIATLARE
ncbi:MerR family transcriptional regulator [Altererythrobacter xixiisoli]|uniref:MerR family transcriptional regulator n=1 Tax=Croceibacterium xixiisoli TaxID=1476466 RepID=A0A6I4TXS5_9SPHN|nr:MerR family transcriptional regulator [Croceibacterium xixiisoli]MXP00827.1 MerR family transcriptional regulator [Croceibacterium xixiisoli]